MTIADIKKTAEAKMGQSIEALKNNLARVRTGRANPSLLDSIHVETTAPWCRCPRWPT
jgi:ribosome recycling factor